MRKCYLISLVIATLFLTVLAKESTIAIMKTSAQNGMESETNALPEIISAKILKYQNFSILMYDQFEGRISKDKLQEINRCHDSVCIIKFTESATRAGFNADFLLFSSIARWGSNLNITVEIADARNGVTFGVASTSIPSLESFHSSTVLDNLIKKIPAYNLRISKKTNKNMGHQFPGIDAIEKDTSFYTILLNDKQTLYNYVNFFKYHDERYPLIVNTLRTTDSTHFPLINIYKNRNPSNNSERIDLITILFSDSLSGINTNVQIQFRGKSLTGKIDEVIFQSDVPSQSRFGSSYVDIKSGLIEKIIKANFQTIKADSISGLYGVKYSYQYSLTNNRCIRLHLIAENSKFQLNIKKE